MRIFSLYCKHIRALLTFPSSLPTRSFSFVSFCPSISLSSQLSFSYLLAAVAVITSSSSSTFRMSFTVLPSVDSVTVTKRRFGKFRVRAVISPSPDV